MLDAFGAVPAICFLMELTSPRSWVIDSLRIESCASILASAVSSPRPTLRTSITCSRPPTSAASENARATAVGFCELATIGSDSSLTKSPALFIIESTTTPAELLFPAFVSSSSLTSLSRLVRPRVSGPFTSVPRTPINAKRPSFETLPPHTSGSRKNRLTASIPPEIRSAAVLSFSK